MTTAASCTPATQGLALLPFPSFKTVEVLESQAAVLRKTVAECPKPRVHRLVHSGVLFLRSGLSGCH